MIGRFFVVAILLSCCPARAWEWQRYSVIEGHEHLDPADPHPLAYYTTRPNLRPDRGFCFPCTETRRAERAKWAEPEATVQAVGSLHGFAVYDVFYVYPCDGCIRPASLKSILVRTGPNKFREIYHYTPTQSDAHAERTQIVQVQGGALLKARYNIGGNKGYFEDKYWTFEADGPMSVDFGVVAQAARSAIPPKRLLYRIGGESPVSITSSVAKYMVNEEGNWLCCPDEIVEVQFRLAGRILAVTGVRYGLPYSNGPSDRKKL